MKKQQILKINLSNLSRRSKNIIVNALKSAYDNISPQYVDYSLKAYDLEREHDQEELLRLNDNYKRVIDEYTELVQALRVCGINVDF